MADLRTKDAGAQLRALQEKLEILTGERTRNPGKAAVTQDVLVSTVERTLANIQRNTSALDKALRDLIKSLELSTGQVTDPLSEVFGTINGLLLAQGINAAFNVTGAAPTFACRAWVHFDSAGAIRNSGNVSSVTRNATGIFTVTFITALPSSNYAAVYSGGTGNDTGNSDTSMNISTRSASSMRFETIDATNNTNLNRAINCLAFFH